MKRRMMLTGGVLAGIAGAGWALRGRAVTAVDRGLNRFAPDPDAPEPDAADLALHRALFIADLHADCLKWDRDLLEWSEYGHADLPRLHAGNTALQVFAMVTHSPVNLPWRDCLSASDPNHAAWLAALQGRPVRSTRGRAEYQIDLFWDAVQRSRDQSGPDLRPELRPVLNASELLALIEARGRGAAVIGGLLGLEGGHWIGQYRQEPGVIEAEVQALHDRGLRVFAPVHRFDNPLCGSSEGCRRYGLTPVGRRALRAAEEAGMVIDLAHASEDAIREAAGMLREPFIVSHTGVRAVCEAPCRPDRNLSEDALRAVLDSGGVVGIGYWAQAVGQGVHNIPRVMAHVMEMAEKRGLDPSAHVALGSDFDGSVATQISADELAVLTALLRRAGGGFDARAIARIMGRNVCKLLALRLPGGSATLVARVEQALAESFA
ncbi:MAG: dipeptidase [Alkalilacustris sp.]